MPYKHFLLSHLHHWGLISTLFQYLLVVEENDLMNTFVCVCVHAHTHTCACAQSLSCVWLFVTPWTKTCQAPLSEFSRQDYLSRLPFLPPVNLLSPRIESTSLVPQVLADRFFTTLCHLVSPNTFIVMCKAIDVLFFSELQLNNRYFKVPRTKLIKRRKIK